MDAALTIIIILVLLAVVGALVARARKSPSPDQPTHTEEGGPRADDKRDRPGGPGQSSQAPRPPEFAPGEAAQGPDEQARGGRTGGLGD